MKIYRKIMQGKEGDRLYRIRATNAVGAVGYFIGWKADGNRRNTKRMFAPAVRRPIFTTNKGDERIIHFTEQEIGEVLGRVKMLGEVGGRYDKEVVLPRGIAGGLKHAAG